MAFGTLSSFDTLAAQGATVAALGEAAVYNAIAGQLAVHNAATREMMGELVEMTTDRQRVYGGADAMVMEELDEFGLPDAQKMTTGATLGLPLRFYGGALQWTRVFFQRTTGEQIANTVRTMMIADVKAIQREIKRALFRPTNYAFEDRRVDHVSLPVRALVNADGAIIPAGPNGETFNAATHTHYLNAATLTAAVLDAQIATIIEHFGAGTPFLYINQGQEAAMRALNAPGQFTGYVDVRINQPQTATYATGRGLDQLNVNNRAIGLYGAAEVWVKPWVLPNYVVGWMGGVPSPLAYRRNDLGTGNLELIFEFDQFPLHARGYGREFGIGVVDRVAAAVLFIGAGGAFVAPTIS